MTIREEIAARFGDNTVRVRNLVVLYKWLETNQAGDLGRWPDLLRAAVVLLHASLEDLLRSLAEWKLPTAPAVSLDRIMLTGSARLKDKEKFGLVELADFRGQTVDAVIARSIEVHLERSSYNHPGEIDELLAKIEVDYKIEKPLRDALAAMMSRRHAIAHRADKDADETAGRGIPLRGRPIDPEAVNRWILAVEEFGAGVLKLV
jgi:hypothetical protein